mgnify:CR=1 FL=1
MINEQLIQIIRDYETLKYNIQPVIISNITKYINLHMNDKLSCESVSKYFKYHPNYLNRMFRKTTGMTLHQYIMRLKIQYATELLLQTDMPITDIALQLSFYDSSHFSNIYIKYTGVSPTKYRKQKDGVEE